ncbi:MAG: PepSY domain-containing protein [Nitrososphaeraceae archaeon]
MALIHFLDFSAMETYKKIVNKKMMIPIILGVGVLLSAIFIVSPLVSTMAQQQVQRLQPQQNEKETIWSQDNAFPTINGSVSISDNVVNFLKENTKIPFIAAAETAQQRITNGTVLGGHLGVTQGYLAYTYLVVNPSDKTINKVIIDAGNGQVLSTSERISWESFGQSRHAEFGHWKGHHSFFGGSWNSLPFGSAPWTSFGSNSNNDRGIGS